MNTYEVKLNGISQVKNKATKMKYIVTDAISCGHAESNAEVDAASTLRDINVTSVQVKKINEIFHKDADRLWYVKMAFIFYDPDTNKEKKITQLFLVGAESAKEAGSILMAELKEQDCEIVNISDSKVDFVISAL